MALDARTRVRQRIKRLLGEHGRSQRALARWLGHKDGWVSSLLAGRFALSLDEFDRTAEFLNVPPSELLRLVDDAWELSPSEMRVVSALRLLPPLVATALLFTACDAITGASNIEYRVTGTGVTRVSVTYQTESGIAQVSSAIVPWSFSRRAKRGDFLYVSAQIIEGNGAATAAIYKGGNLFKSTVSSGFAAIATASGSLE